MTTQPPDLKKLREVRDWHRNTAGVLEPISNTQSLMHKEMADSLDRAIDAYEGSARDAEDAARYRYIKSQMEVGAVQTQLPLYRSLYWVGTHVDCNNVTDADEAIDAARHATQGD